MSSINIELDAPVKILEATGRMLLDLAGVKVGHLGERVIVRDFEVSDLAGQQADDTLPDTPAAMVVPVHDPDIFDPTGQQQGSAGTRTVSDGPKGAELDSAGLPWDECIHSSGRSQKADGTWKIKRGTAKPLVDQVMAELRTVMQPVGGGTQHQDPAHTTTNIQNNAAAQNAFGNNQANPNAAPMIWPEFLGKVIAKQGAKTLDKAKMDDLMAANGVEGGVSMMINREDLWPLFIQELAL